VCSLAAILCMLYLAAFLSMLCLDTCISSYGLILHQPRLQDLSLSASCQMHNVLTGQCHLLSLAARVHNAIPIIYALLHCRCKSRPCLAFNLDNFTGIRSRESPSSQGCKGMFVAKLKFHFDINVNINGICGNIS